MGTKTIDTLIKCIYDNKYPSNPTIFDYFGIDKNDEDLKIIFNIYTELVNYKGISKELIENCFFTKRLNELIHMKYTYEQSDNYQQFCKNNIKLEGALLANKNIKELPIYDDNHCSNCNEEGYITKHKSVSPPDCAICFKWICRSCSNYNSEEVEYICKSH